MNIQAMLKQAQNMQKDMMKAQEEINSRSYTGENGLVKVTMKGNKKVEKVEISKDEDFTKDDLEMLEDMIMVAVNEAVAKIEQATEQKMGKYTSAFPGLF